MYARGDYAPLAIQHGAPTRRCSQANRVQAAPKLLGGSRTLGLLQNREGSALQVFSFSRWLFFLSIAVFSVVL